MPHFEEKHTVGEIYFKLDGDADEICTSEEFFDDEETLTWRGNPEVTQSDWRLLVVTPTGQRKYNIHKRVLSDGPRSCKYFSTIFSNYKYKQDHQKKDRCTRINLEEKDAANFPIMLDFIYAGISSASLKCDGTVETADSTIFSSTSLSLQSSSSTLEEDSTPSLGESINTLNAVSLRFLARRFGCQALTLAVNKFIQRDLSCKTGPIYFQLANSYKDRRLFSSSKLLMCDNFEDVSAKALMQLPLDLLKALATSLNCGTRKDNNISCILSEVVYLYLERHPSSFTVANLLFLTDEKIMPAIGPEPAIGFTGTYKDVLFSMIHNHYFKRTSHNALPICLLQHWYVT